MKTEQYLQISLVAIALTLALISFASPPEVAPYVLASNHTGTNCTDTDGGIVLKVQGTVNGVQTDFCIGGTPMLLEYACDPCNSTNQTRWYTYNCLTYGFTGCSGGACIPNTVPEPILPNVCTCGNGVVDPGEACDDGSPYPMVPADACANCNLTFCGDGWVQSPNGQGTGGPNNDGYETCDDGNSNPGDGCYNCFNTTTVGCGDPVANCSVTCPAGYTCTGYTPGSCGGNCTPPLAVNWAYYYASCGEQNSINIYWGTTIEVDTLGFYVKRAPLQSGPYSTISPFIFATGSGSNYQYTDNNPFPGIYNWYKVQELTSNGPGDETAPFTTERLCDEPTYCGGISGQQCPEGYTCVCPPRGETSDEQCLCEPQGGVGGG